MVQCCLETTFCLKRWKKNTKTFLPIAIIMRTMMSVNTGVSCSDLHSLGPHLQAGPSRSTNLEAFSCPPVEHSWLYTHTLIVSGPFPSGGGGRTIRQAKVKNQTMSESECTVWVCV